MALCTHRVAREQVQCGDLGGFAAHAGFGVLANQHASFVVVGGKQGVGAFDRVGGAVQCDELHALGLRLFDAGDDGLGIARCDQNGLGTRCHHVFNGRHLASVVTICLACGADQLGAHLFGFGLGAFFHLHKKGICFGFCDQPDHRLTRSKGAGNGKSQG